MKVDIIPEKINTGSFPQIQSVILLPAFTLKISKSVSP